MSDHQQPIDDERELARLYGKLPRARPSPALDEAVLRQAREAIPATDTAASSPKGRPRFGLRWAGALAVAASLVLAANLAWQQRQLPAPNARLESATDKAKPAPAAPVGENAIAPGTGSAPQPAPATEDEVAARKAAPPEQAVSLSQARDQATVERYVATLPAPSSPPAAVQGRNASAAAPRAFRTPPPPQITERALAEPSRPAPAPPPSPAKIGTPLLSPAAAAPELAESAPSVEERQGLGEVNDSRGNAEPQRRVAAIRQMLRDGHEASARKAYVDLRRDFPGFVVPRDLAPLAK